MITALVPFFGAGPLLKREARYEEEEDGEEKGTENGDIKGGIGATGDIVVCCGGNCDHEYSWYGRRVLARYRPKGGETCTELNDDFAKVIGMARDGKQADVADFSFILGLASENVLLNVGYAFEEEAEGEENDAGNIGSGAECRLLELGHVGRVENGDRQRDRPDPYHLEDPEAEEGEEFVAFVVEAVILAGLDDAEEQEGGQSGAPEHDEHRRDDLPGMMMVGEG